MAYFKNAYHKLCITCHKDMKAKNLELAEVVDSARQETAEDRADILPGVPPQINFSGPERKGPEKFMIEPVNAVGCDAGD